MLKPKLKDMPVLFIHINPADKEALKNKAEKFGMQLTTYCRMVLLKDLEIK
jgi:hypothetical protein